MRSWPTRCSTVRDAAVVSPQATGDVAEAAGVVGLVLVALDGLDGLVDGDEEVPDPPPAVGEPEPEPVGPPELQAANPMMAAEIPARPAARRVGRAAGRWRRRMGTDRIPLDVTARGRARRARDGECSPSPWGAHLASVARVVDQGTSERSEPASAGRGVHQEGWRRGGLC